MYSGALSLDDPLQAFFFRATWINVIAWGIGYVLAGRLSAAWRSPSSRRRRREAYFGACLPIFLSGRGGRTMLLATGIFDVIFAAFFAHVLWLRRPGKPAVG
jgi:hypothetical protein